MARVAASESVGGSSRANHLRKLLKDAQSGRIPLPPEDIQEIQEELDQLNWKPPPWIHPVYATYWEIRITKGHDSPINHQDVHAWRELRGVELDNWAIDLILEWDRAYYEATRKRS